MIKTLATLESSGSRPAGQTAIAYRSIELEELRARVAARRSFLFHGPMGVGKTLLLSAACSEFPAVLWSAQTQTPQALHKNLAKALWIVRDPTIIRACPAGVSDFRSKSAVALKGLVREALRNSGYLVILDHLVRPSQSLAASVREVMTDCSVPVVAVSRSDHMEDAGFVLRMFPDRSDRYTLRNFDSDKSKLFSAWCAENEGLAFENLAQFLDNMVAYSEGNPGAIMHMIRMAKSPKYSRDGQIKGAPLYIDFKLAMVNQ